MSPKVTNGASHHSGALLEIHVRGASHTLCHPWEEGVTRADGHARLAPGAGSPEGEHLVTQTEEAQGIGLAVRVVWRPRFERAQKEVFEEELGSYVQEIENL